MTDLQINVRSWRGEQATVAVGQDEQPLFLDTVRPGSRRSRQTFLDEALRRCPGLQEHRASLEQELMNLLPPTAVGAPSGAGPDPEPPGSDTDLLLDLAADVELVHNERGEFAVFQVAHHREVWQINSTRFRDHLIHLFLRATDHAPSSRSLEPALATLQAKAKFAGREAPVFLRTATVESTIWIDLCDEEWRAVRVDRDGWTIVSKPDVLFQRRPGMQALPTPSPGGKLEDFFSLFNLDKPDHRVLVTAWLVNAILQVPTYPILVLLGEQGSGKSTTTRALRRLIDPHRMDVRSPPEGTRDIVVAATHGHVLAFENLSGLSDKLSDDLCRLSTGAAFGTRKLYSDDDEQQFRVSQPVILNGIDELTGRSDLADRSIVLYLPSIPVGQRATEQEIWTSFGRRHSHWLGVILDLVVKTLRLPEPLGARRERMADFSVLGAKIESALEWPANTFTDTYNRCREAATVCAFEASSIGPVLLRLVEGPLTVSAAELLDRLTRAASELERRHPRWPRSPRGMTNEVRRLQPALRLHGIQVDELGRGGSRGAYRYHFRRTDVGDDVQDPQNVQCSAGPTAPGEQDREQLRTF